MKKIILLIFISTTVFGQAPKIEWQRAYGSTMSEKALNLKATSNGYLINGSTNRFEYDEDGKGDLDDSIFSGPWSFSINNSGNITGQSRLNAYQTPDGGYLMVKDSIIEVDNYDFYINIYIEKRDSGNNLKWKRLYGGKAPMDDYYYTRTNNFNDFHILPDGNFLILGRTSSINGDLEGVNDIGQVGIWLFKIDKDNGDITWQMVHHYDGFFYKDLSPFSWTLTDDKAFVISTHQSFDRYLTLININNGNVVKEAGLTSFYKRVISQKIDNGYLMVANTDSEYGPDAGYTKIVHLDDTLGIVKEKLIDASGNNIFSQKIDTGYLIVVNNSDDYTSPDYSHAKIMHLNDTLGVIKEKFIESTGTINYITSTDDGGFLATGGSADSSIPGRKEAMDLWVLKLNNEFCIEWQGLYGGTGSEEGIQIISTDDGGFAVIGNTNSLDGDVTGTHFNPMSSWYIEEDIWLVKLTPECNLNLQVADITHPSAYGALDGSIQFSSNLPDGNHLLYYTYEEDENITQDSVLVEISSEKFTVTSLASGEYYDFKIIYNECEATLYSNSCIGPQIINIDEGDIEGLPDYIHRYDPTTGKTNEFARKAVILHPGTIIDAKSTGTYRAEVKDK